MQSTKSVFASKGAKRKAIAKARSAESIVVYRLSKKLKLCVILNMFEGLHTKKRSYDMLYNILHAR
jgi:hypothetical protein